MSKLLLFFVFIISISASGQNFGLYHYDDRSDLQPLDYLNGTLKSSGQLLAPSVWQEDSVKKNFTQSKAFRISIGPAILFTAGALSWPIREGVREARNRFIPEFEDHYDDVAQFVPGLAVYGLNAAGVKGKHSLGRASASMAFGAAITGLTVFVMKETTGVLRPDGSARNSFPSGHTATSVVSATFLHKEYGQYRDPLYSVGGYAFAGATAIGRQLNNRHWISDVLVGAGIGLLGSELGYLIADKIFRDRGLNAPLTTSGFDRERGKPTFVLAKLGFATASRDIADQNNDLSADKGYSIGFEGAYFFSRYIGIGADISMAGFPIVTSENFQTGNPEIDSRTQEFVTDALGTRSFFIGPYINIPFNEDLSLVAKLTVGPAFGARGGLNSILTPAAEEEIGLSEAPIYDYRPDNTIGWGTGASLRKVIGRNIALNVFWDFYQATTDITWSAYEYDEATMEFVVGNAVLTESTKLNYSSFGISVAAMIW